MSIYVSRHIYPYCLTARQGRQKYSERGSYGKIQSVPEKEKY
jgi:hypothetical protein